MELLRFSCAVILTGPLTNVYGAYNMLIDSGAKIDLAKTQQTKEVLVCVNRSIILPEYQAQVKCGWPIQDYMHHDYSTVFWQSRRWWDFYHNVAKNPNSLFITLNVFKQLKEFKEEYCIWK